MRTLFLLLFLTLSFGLSAQNKIVFTYDDAGNRTFRETLPLILREEEHNADTESLTKILLFSYDINAHPNPTFGQVSIEIEDFEIEKPLDVVVYDQYNLLLQRHVMREPIIHIDLSQYPSATWYIVAFMLDGERRDFKIIKQ